MFGEISKIQTVALLVSQYITAYCQISCETHKRLSVSTYSDKCIFHIHICKSIQTRYQNFGFAIRYKDLAATKLPVQKQKQMELSY